jgi:hypothetical protein
MIRRWLLSLIEADVRALVRDEVDLYLLDLGLDDRQSNENVRAYVSHLWTEDWDCAADADYDHM